MKVILVRPVPKVGKTEDIVEVSEGFARNALFPKQLAIPATSAAIAQLQRKQSSRAAEKAVRQTLLDRAVEETEGKSFTYAVPATDHGSLFSKINAKTISEYLLKNHRLAIDPTCIVIPSGVIKKTGDYQIEIKDGAYHSLLTITIKKQ